MSENKFEFHFHAPVGQNIANVEHMDVHLDKDGQKQVMNVEQVSVSKRQKSDDSNLTEAGIRAVFDAKLCKPAADWAVVVKILEEKGEIQKNSYTADAEMINNACGTKVTSANALSRSPIFTKIAGEYPHWMVRKDEQNRETAGKLRTYLEIGRVFTQALDAISNHPTTNKTK